MEWSSVSAVASACIAFAAVVLSVAFYRATQRAEDKRERNQRMPVLVVYVTPDRAIVVSNIGTGPALNVFLAGWESTSTSEESLPLEPGDTSGGTWFNPVHLRPIPVGGEETIPPQYLTKLSAGLGGVGIAYTDPFRFAYFTKMSEYGTIVCVGQYFPAWSAAQAPYPIQLPASGRWP